MSQTTTNNPETTCCQSSACESQTSARPPVVKPNYHSTYGEDRWDVQVFVPGVKREQVEVSVEDEILDIQATRVSELPENWRPLGGSGEIGQSRHYRLRLDVGSDVDESSIVAKLSDGVLRIHLPLKEEVKPRSIAIE